MKFWGILCMNYDSILKLVNDETYYMIDIDGVCIDTESRIAPLAAQIGFKEAFKIINWHDHIFASNQINGSLDILRDIQSKLKRIQLLTQNHTLEEEREKILFFRQNGIFIPIVSVPPKVSKFEVVSPEFYDGNIVLVDDREKQVVEWNDAGGIGVLFTQDEQPKEYRKVKSLEFLKMVK